MPEGDGREAGGASNVFAALRSATRAAARATEEECDLCGEPIPAAHRHLLHLDSREILCACTGCSILFDRAEAGAGKRRLIPTRRLHLLDFDLSDMEWQGLRIPVDMAFFTESSQASRVVAYYPSPAGATESLLSLETWEDLQRRNSVLTEMEPDVEALLVNRVRGVREYFVVPIDDCYKLVGTVRVYWRGLSGGREVWQQIDWFFADLKAHARPQGGAHA